MSDAGVTAISMAILAVVNLAGLAFKHYVDTKSRKDAAEKIEAATVAAASAYVEANNLNKKIENLQAAEIGGRRKAD